MQFATVGMSLACTDEVNWFYICNDRISSCSAANSPDEQLILYYDTASLTKK